MAVSEQHSQADKGTTDIRNATAVSLRRIQIPDARNISETRQSDGARAPPTSAVTEPEMRRSLDRFMQRENVSPEDESPVVDIQTAVSQYNLVNKPLPSLPYPSTPPTSISSEPNYSPSEVSLESAVSGPRRHLSTISHQQSPSVSSRSLPRRSHSYPSLRNPDEVDPRLFAEALAGLGTDFDINLDMSDEAVNQVPAATEQNPVSPETPQSQEEQKGAGAPPTIDEVITTAATPTSAPFSAISQPTPASENFPRARLRLNPISTTHRPFSFEFGPSTPVAMGGQALYDIPEQSLRRSQSNLVSSNNRRPFSYELDPAVNYGEDPNVVEQRGLFAAATAGLDWAVLSTGYMEDDESTVDDAESIRAQRQAAERKADERRAGKAVLLPATSNEAAREQIDPAIVRANEIRVQRNPQTPSMEELRRMHRQRVMVRQQAAGRAEELERRWKRSSYYQDI